MSSVTGHDAAAGPGRHAANNVRDTRVVDTRQDARSLLEVENLVVQFAAGKKQKPLRVLNEVSLSLKPGEILGIVGESGCGKSMTALSIMGLVPSPPGQIAGGKILLDGEDLLQLDADAMRKVRGKRISMIFQEPMTSLNPVFTVGEQIAEVLRLHENLSSRQAASRSIDMLKAVDIPEPERRAQAYPHQLSGGMRQRIMIAIGLACRPEVLIADEPTTALDATVQAQIFDLLKNLQEQTGTAIILITHDMGAIAELADRVAVMYAGRIIEQGNVDDVLNAPAHPYTQGLIACVPHLDASPSAVRQPLVEIPGVVPALDELGDGCAFAARCAYRMPRCERERPVLRDCSNGHARACWLELTSS